MTFDEALASAEAHVEAIARALEHDEWDAPPPAFTPPPALAAPPAPGDAGRLAALVARYRDVADALERAMSGVADELATGRTVSGAHRRYLGTEAMNTGT